MFCVFLFVYSQFGLHQGELQEKNVAEIVFRVFDGVSESNDALISLNIVENNQHPNPEAGNVELDEDTWILVELVVSEMELIFDNMDFPSWLSCFVLFIELYDYDEMECRPVI